MGCTPSKKSQNILETRVKNPNSLNNFKCWHQIFDFLEFKELLLISSVCKIFNEQAGYPSVIDKFKSFGKGWRIDSITDVQNSYSGKKDISQLVIDDSVDVGQTPSFLSPNEASRRSIDSKRDTQSNLLVMHSENLGNNSLDSFLPSSNFKGVLLMPIYEEPLELVQDGGVLESATFKPVKDKGNLDPQLVSNVTTSNDDLSDFETFKENI